MPVRVPDPQVPDDVTFSELDRDVRGRLRTLSKDSAERVGRHLVMVGRLLDSDPELAYEHAQAAVRRGGRVDVVREAAGLAAYRTGRYGEALRELRTVRRLNGSPEHLPVMADCERGLGRPERALVVAQDPQVSELDEDALVELAMVVSGARLDLEEPEAALAALSTAAVRAATGVLAARVAQARATALDACGRHEEAERELAVYTAEQLAEAAGDVLEEDDVVVYDLLDEGGDIEEPGGVEAADDESRDDEATDDEAADDGPESDEVVAGRVVGADVVDDATADTGEGSLHDGAVAGPVAPLPGTEAVPDDAAAEPVDGGSTPAGAVVEPTEEDA